MSPQPPAMEIIVYRYFNKNNPRLHTHMTETAMFPDCLTKKPAQSNNIASRKKRETTGSCARIVA